MKASRQKFRLDSLFVGHAVVAWICGALAILMPHTFEAFWVPHEDDLGVHPGGPEKIVHLVVRLYGALIFAQGFIVWSARSVADAAMRKGLVQAYCIAFTLTFLALLRAQLTGGMGALNWVNIGLFAGLAGVYAWFIFVEPIHVFELPSRTMA